MRFNHIDDDPRLTYRLMAYARTPWFSDYRAKDAWLEAVESLSCQDREIRMGALADVLKTMVPDPTVVRLVAGDSPGDASHIVMLLEQEGYFTYRQKFIGIYWDTESPDSDDVKEDRLVADLMVDNTDPGAAVVGVEWIDSCVVSSDQVMLTPNSTFEDLRKVAIVMFSWWRKEQLKFEEEVREAMNSV